MEVFPPVLYDDSPVSAVQTPDQQPLHMVYSLDLLASQAGTPRHRLWPNFEPLHLGSSSDDEICVYVQVDSVQPTLFPKYQSPYLVLRHSSDADRQEQGANQHLKAEAFPRCNSYEVAYSTTKRKTSKAQLANWGRHM